MKPGREELRRHLLEALLPLWRDHGRHRDSGAFRERLHPDLHPASDGTVRLVVQTRQIYCFSHASVLGAADWALETARRGVDFLLSAFLDVDHGGWFFKTSPDGTPVDTRKDTYAHAFVLFALAWYYRASADARALEHARETLELLDEHLADCRYGGYLEAGDRRWRPVEETRRQNPHMHLLEALLALHEATADAATLGRAASLVELFRRRFLDEERGCLGELFGEDWSPLLDARAAWLEPGHHFEWVWLLHAYAERTGDTAVLRDADRLHDFALRHGVDPQGGGVYDRIDREGRILDSGQRVWPQTEYLKALAVRRARGDADAARRLDEALPRLFRERVIPAHGGWRERVARDGRVLESDLYGSSVYHITCALAEVMRLES